MTENNHEIWEIIANVLNGSASSDEMIRFNFWLNESEKNRKFYNIILSSHSATNDFTSESKERIYNHISQEINSEKPVKSINLWMYSAVASVAIIITLIFYHLVLSGNFKSNQIPLVESKVPYGAQTKILLADSSIVYINSGSVIQYPSVFKGRERKVKISGEAFFHVAPDKKHPFLVEAGNVIIKVHGTRFNVKNFENQKIIETVLLEGSVEVYSKDNRKEPILLKPNQKAVFNKTSGIFTSRKADAELESIWKDGKYYFENEEFSMIAQSLERHFNVKIIINSSELEKKVFSGLFDSNRTIFQILQVMKEYSSFTYTAKNDTIYINK